MALAQWRPRLVMKCVRCARQDGFDGPCQCLPAYFQSAPPKLHFSNTLRPNGYRKTYEKQRFLEQYLLFANVVPD